MEKMRNNNDPRCQIRGTQANFVGALKSRSYPGSRQCGEEQFRQRLTVVLVLSDAELVRTA